MHIDTQYFGGCISGDRCTWGAGGGGSAVIDKNGISTQ